MTAGLLRRLARLETGRQRDANDRAADPATAARAWAEIDAFLRDCAHRKATGAGFSPEQEAALRFLGGPAA